MSGPAIPGDVGGLSGAAATFDGLMWPVQQAISAILQVRGGTLGAAVWSGPAATAFRSSSASVESELTELMRFLQALGPAVHRYAAELERLQSEYATIHAAFGKLAAELALMTPLPVLGSLSVAQELEATLQRMAAKLSQLELLADELAARFAAELSSLPTPPKTGSITAAIPNLGLLQELDLMLGIEPSPQLQQGDGIGYVPQLGVLFGPGGPQLGDIQQGPLGDCYFLSSIAAVLRVNPGAIENMIHDNGNGTYTVTFADGSTETVDTLLPIADNPRWTRGSIMDDTTATPGNVPVLWVAIVEKAYAQRQHNDYNNIGNGGNEATTLPLLDPSSRATQIPTDAPGIDSIIQTALAHGAPITAGTPDLTNNPLAKQLNVVGGHAYYVVGYDAVHHTVLLGNPWGTSADVTPKPIPIDQLPQLVDEVTVATPK